MKAGLGDPGLEIVADRLDKNLDRDDLTRQAIDELGSAAGEVDKQLLAGDMGLTHRRLQPPAQPWLEIAEPGIAEPVGRADPLLLPQQRQGHIGAAPLAMHPGPVAHRALIRGDRQWWREQHRFQLRVIEIFGQWPAHAGSASPAEIAANRSLAQAPGSWQSHAAAARWQTAVAKLRGSGASTLSRPASRSPVVRQRSKPTFG